MSAKINFVPRFDSGESPGIIDSDRFDGARRSKRGVFIPSLGWEIQSTADAVKRMVAQYGKIDHEMDERQVQDAAADFVTSGLEQVLSPGDDLRRGEDRPLLFVPGPGRQPLIPSSNKLRPGMRITSYKVREPTGQARWVDPDSVRELERSGYRVEKKTNGAEWYGIAYGSSLPETWEADELGEDLLGERQNGAVIALDDFREMVSGWGDVDRNLPGFMTLGDALLVLGGQQFSSGGPTALQQLERIATFEQLFKRANDEKMPTAILAPDSDRIAMQTSYFGVGGEGPSVWERAIEMFPWLKNVRWSERMSTGNAAGDGSRWVIYSQNPSELYIEHTETMLFGPFPDMMEMSFVMLRRHGGVINKRPERVMYVDFTP